MQKSSTNAVFEDPAQQTAESGQLDLANDAFLDYDFDADADTTLDFDFPGSDALLENLAENDTSVLSELDRHEKRKSLDGTDVADNGGGKRRESEDKTAKKPGRKPLTSEPTSVCNLVPQIAVGLSDASNCRSAKHRTGLRREPSGNAKRSTFWIWRQRSRTLRKPHLTPRLRTAC